jgi:primosomal protein N' (replication factor Y) (superfamily II helicase)
MSYAEIYVAIKTLGICHPFDYKIPPDLEDKVKVGSVVAVPFGNRQETGYVTRLKNNSKFDGKEIKPVTRILRDVPIFDRDRLRLIYWMAAYYVAPVVKIMEFFVPSGKKIKKNLQSGCVDFQGKPPESAIVYTFKNENKTADNIIFNTEMPMDIRAADSLEADGSAAAAEPAVRIISKVAPEGQQTLINESLRPFIADIIANAESDDFKGFLFKDFNELQKNEIMEYLALKMKKSEKKMLVLAPEIADIKNIYSSVALKNNMDACLYYSEKTPSKKFEDWFEISRNRYDAIFGTRSAIFLPVNRLGIIIIDEADDQSYKESTIVRYNLKDVALKLAKILKIPCVLFANSASINLRHDFSVRNGMQTVNNPDGSAGKYLFKRQIIDLKTVDRSKEDINITTGLFKSIREETGKDNKAVIFVNKRGYSSFLICRKCGNIPKCESCNTAFKYHSSQKKLICHHCQASVDFTGTCSLCGSDEFSSPGAGIEKIEFKLKQRFKDIALFRIDSDKLKKKNELKETLSSVNSAGPAILLGTQIIAKDIKIKNATLMGIIDFDTLFNLPDYSINEKACQILIKLSAVLKNNSDSTFIIQAYNTQNYILKSFTASDFNIFYEEEIKNRKELFYPPFSHLVNIIVSGKDESPVKSDINRLFSEICRKEKPDFLLLGPSPAPFYRLNQHYRWHILVKTEKIMQFAIFLGKILAGFKKNESNKIITDVDPVWIL